MRVVRSLLIGIRAYSKRSRRKKNLSKWNFYFSVEIWLFRKQKRWISDAVSWAINALNQIQMLTNWHKKKFWDSHFQFMTYSTAGMDVDWTAANCNTNVWYDNCILTISSKISRHKCQFTLHNDAILMLLHCHDDFEYMCVFVMLSG